MKLQVLIRNTAILKEFLKSNKMIHDNRWLFSSTDNIGYNYNSKYLFEYVFNNYPNIGAYYVMNDEQKRQELNKRFHTDRFINTATKQGALKALSCKVWFTSAGLPLYAKGLYKHYDIINLWHGIPLKKIALEDKNLSIASRIAFREIFSKNYKYILTSSKALVPIMAKSFGVPESKIKIWGQPRCDVLFDENDRERLLKDLYNREIKPKKLILYAPTFRDDEETKLFCFDDFNISEFNRFLKENDIYILVRKHIKEKADFSSYFSENILDFSKTDDVMELLNIFDMLITDYSSLYIDYLKLNRPIIFLTYDRDKYLNGRGFNFEQEKLMPGAFPTGMQYFMQALLDKDSYENERNNVRSILDTTDDRVCENICQNIIREMNLS